MHAPVAPGHLQPQGRHREDHHVRQHRRGPRVARAQGAPRRHRLAGQRRRLARRQGREDALPRARHGRSRRATPRCTSARTSTSSSSNETLAAAELYLAGRQNRDRILRDRLASAFDDVRRRPPRLLAVAVADEPERARRRRRHPRAGRVRLPLARRRAAGRQDGEERQPAAAPPGADPRRAADLLRRARAHLPRRGRRAEGALRRPRAAADPPGDAPQGGAGAGQDDLRVRARVERGARTTCASSTCWSTATRPREGASGAEGDAREWRSGTEEREDEHGRA